MKKEDILGSWTLESHGKFDLAGKFSPTAEKIMGKLIYAQNGSMSVLILTKDEPTELADLIVYSGKFSMSGKSINHHIEVSPRPSRRNTTEVRLAEIKEDRLILKTEPDETGHYEIQWRRESPLLA